MERVAVRKRFKKIMCMVLCLAMLLTNNSFAYAKPEGESYSETEEDATVSEDETVSINNTENKTETTDEQTVVTNGTDEESVIKESADDIEVDTTENSIVSDNKEEIKCDIQSVSNGEEFEINSSETNFITNGGFENGLNNWICSDCVIFTASQFYEGSGAASLRGESSGSEGNFSVSQDITLSEKGTYDISLWVRGNIWGAGIKLGETTVKSGLCDSSWTYKEFTGTYTKTTDVEEVLNFEFYGTCQHWTNLDNVSVTKQADADSNLLSQNNPSFEDDTCWSYSVQKFEKSNADNAAKDGTYYLRNTEANLGRQYATQSITGLPAGKYILSAYFEGSAGTDFLSVSTNEGVIAHDEIMINVGWESSSWQQLSLPFAVGSGKNVTVSVGAVIDSDIWFRADAVSLVSDDSADYKQYINALLTSANAVNKSIYTTETYNALVTASQNAQDAVNSATSDNEDTYNNINEKAIALKSALDGLKKSLTGNLQIKLAEAKTIVSSNYTDASYAILKSAISAGETVVSNNGPTQADVDTAMSDLQSAIDGLCAATLLNTDFETAGDSSHPAKYWTITNTDVMVLKENSGEAHSSSKYIGYMNSSSGEAYVYQDISLNKGTYKLTDYRYGMGTDVAIISVNNNEKKGVIAKYNKDRITGDDAWSWRSNTLEFVIGEDETPVRIYVGGEYESGDWLRIDDVSLQKTATITDAKAYLKSVLSEAAEKEENQTLYSEESYSSFNTAYSTAKTVSSNSEATYKQINDAVIDLQEKMDALVITARGRLQASINEAKENYKAEDYTAASYANLTSVLDNAQAAVNDTGTTEAALEQHIQNIADAIAALVPVNVIINGGFEDGLNNWTKDTGAGESFSSTDKSDEIHSGSKAAHIWYSNETAAENAYMYQEVTLPYGKYILSANAMGGGGAVFLRVMDGTAQIGGAYENLTGWTADKNAWLQPDSEFVI
ncbi:MAG: FIVAR domain-containing protein, partial [Lachnospiraceae bacterium]|nr:FIVAR domain-containing protein [Lachnospiraceae bacterium]